MGLGDVRWEAVRLGRHEVGICLDDFRAEVDHHHSVGPSPACIIDAYQSR